MIVETRQLKIEILDGRKLLVNGSGWVWNLVDGDSAETSGIGFGGALLGDEVREGAGLGVHVWIKVSNSSTPLCSMRA